MSDNAMLVWIVVVVTLAVVVMFGQATGCYEHEVAVSLERAKLEHKK